MGRTVVAYFTGTGNTLYLAKKIKDAELVSIIDVLDGKITIPEDTDRLGIMSPVYGAGLPYPTRCFIRNYLSQRDNSALGYIFALLTHGGSPMSAEWIVDRELQNIGLNISYTASIKMPDGYLPLFRKSPDEEKTREVLLASEAKIQKVLEDIEKEEMHLPVAIPLFSRLTKKFSETFNKEPRAPEKRLVVTEKCVGCGICEKVCPMNNIRLEDGKAVLGDQCLSCFTCYHRCPSAAFSFGKVEGQYKGLVSTKELEKR